VENEISVRVKLNKLQLSKVFNLVAWTFYIRLREINNAFHLRYFWHYWQMNELTEKVLQAEEDLKICDHELEKLQVV